ncbi:MULTISPECIES: hypothetical protein [Hydrogenophaga]|uniref:Uncharacterized protein n=1 Tax=Hydrogenophaga intermedia TaxID=65786 RepID=A0A1L1PJ76_HYDIT|nr:MULTISPECIES: hypothetical protein [Hydrogenophaga]TMU72046.1 hypothetical protein FGJ01_20545 [Hydrogenophaga intermedia]CDN89978.1 hypothetical protein BN948_04418 [Hydrogenophaga intermedia]
MNGLKVSKTLLVKQGADGERAQVVIDGSNEAGELRWAAVKALKPPKKEVETALIRDDGTYVPLPFCELAWLLPDRTGVLVIFRPGSYTHPNGSDVFPRPNNAAIFNADGSLRFQVHFAGAPERSASYVIGLPFTRTITHKIMPIGRPGEPIVPPIVQFGVLVGPRDDPSRFIVQLSSLRKLP